MTQTWSGASPSIETLSLDEPTRPWTELPIQPAPSMQIVPSPRETPEPPARPRLVITRGPDAGTGFTIGTPRTTIGRGRDCDIVVDDTTVSHRHAEVRQRDGGYVLEDGDSLNGTYVNRSPVPWAELVDGDEIWIGKARFTFRTGE
jgi:pSer/pThr/pTyr-binding forkhead associated (FHA) protein